MGLLIDKIDFVGKYHLSKMISDKIDYFIDYYERAYLYEVLGKPLADLLIADLVNKVPQSPEYIAIYNDIYLSGNCCCNSSNKFNKGLKDILLGFVWYEYVRQTKHVNTGVGMVTNVSEISKNSDFTHNFLYKNYNDAVDGANVIQCYIKENSATYPLFCASKMLNNYPFI